MFYVKTKINEAIELKIDLYEDEIFTTCPDCNKEMQVEEEVLIDVLKSDSDFCSTQIICKECTDKRRGKK